MVLFSLIGTLFSGYLTFAKMVMGSCPLAESCIYLFGYPTCVYGFVMFLIMLISSLCLMKKKYKEETMMKIVSYVSLIGVLFSLYFAVQEIFFPTCPGGVCSYGLLLPTCVYGFIFYIVVFSVSYKLKK
jgi:uncharacterized membrane protein